MDKSIVLIRPAYQSVYDYYKKTQIQKRQVNPPLGLLFLAAYAREIGGYTVRIVDGEIDGLGPKEIAARVSQWNPGLIGITATTAEIQNAADIAGECKALLPNTPVIVGGAHATSCPKRTLEEFPAFDMVAVGEGEMLLKDVADAVIRSQGQLGDIPGLCHRAQDTTIVLNSPRLSLADFDAIPMPAWDLINLEKYFYPMGKKGMQRFAMVQTSRGCPNQCIFCFQQFGRRVRYRSTPRIMEEINYLQRHSGVEFINFVDDTFTLNKLHVTDLLKALIELETPIRFKCMTRADSVTPDLIRLLMQAGCVRLSMGVESGNDEMLVRIKKHATKDMYRKAYRIIHEHGIECRASFILGLPYETMDSVADTIAFAKELDIYHAAFNIATPYPGTELYSCALQESGYRFIDNHIQWSDFKRWGGVVALPDGFSKEQMLALQKYAHAEFYGQPKIENYYTRLMDTITESEYYFRPFLENRQQFRELNEHPTPLYAALKMKLQEREPHRNKP